MLGTIREFWRDQRGVAMILVAIMLPVLIGFSVLAVDMSRLNGLHNDLQKGVDALALAAAAELDGRSDSITRANRAIDNLLTNKTLFSTSGVHQLVTSDITVTYLTGIPASDDIGLSAAGVDSNNVTWASTDPKAVSFAEVTVKQSATTDGAGAFATIFPASFIGSTDTLDIQPQAVAGFEQSICDTVPVFMCNPFETTTPGTSQTIQQAFASGNTYSREFHILQTSNDPGPGNFGLLDNNLQSLRDAVAKGTAGTCYNRNALTTKTGVTYGQINTGLNVRFDVYSGSLNSQSNNWDYRPASNVRKGQKKNTCNKYDPVTDGSALPLPPGVWDAGNNAYSQKITSTSTFYQQYWKVNHKGASAPSIPSKSYPTGDTSQPASRYDVYRYEIDNSKVADKSNGPTNEVGTPQCFNNGKAPLPTADPDRRLINLAVIDCLASANAIKGRTEIKADGYASIFLITPITKVNSNDNDDGNGAEKPISFEIVDVDGPLGNGSLDKALRNEAQLYR
jgi:Flp pilus assembly protein TadG